MVRALLSCRTRFFVGSRSFSNSSVSSVSEALKKLASGSGREVRFSISSQDVVQFEWVKPLHSSETLAQSTIFGKLEDVVSAASLKLSELQKPLFSTPANGKPTNVIFDWSSGQQDPRVEANKKIQQKYPRLSIHTTHTTGVDLQGNKTHTISVELRSMDNELDGNEVDAISKFRGESVGLGFKGTLKRALGAAFDLLGESFSVGSEQISEPHQSVIGLYAQILGNKARAEFDHLRSTCIVKHENVVATEIHHSSLIVAFLTALEHTAGEVDFSACEEIKKKLTTSGLFVLLPERAVNIKLVLDKIVQFYFGVGSSATVVEVASSNGLFTSKVILTLPLESVHLASEDVCLVLAQAIGRSKKKASELALVKSLEDHFSNIYQEQIAFHPEVERMRKNENASEKGDVCPHISRGLQCQLEWACQREGLISKLNCVRIAPQTMKDPELSSHATTWTTTVELFPIKKEEDKRDDPIFYFSVSDQRKSRSTQKAIGATLFLKFRSQCSEAVEYAVKQRLINSDGTPVISEKIIDSHSDLKEEQNEGKNDPLINALNMAPNQFVKGPEVQQPSVLQLYRSWGIDFARKRYHSQHARMIESISSGTSECTIKLIAVLESPNGDAIEQLEYVSVSDMKPIRGIFRAYVRLLELSEGQGDDVQHLYDLIKNVEGGVGTSLVTHPLSSVAELLRKLYGFALVINTFTDQSFTVVRIFGVPPSVVEKEGVSLAANVPSDRYYLGRGEGLSLSSAALSACRQVYNMHIKVLKVAFADDQLESFSTVVSIEKQSQLWEMLSTVVEEIKISLARGISCIASIEMKYTQNESSSIVLSFLASTNTKTVQLEKQSGNDFLSVLQALCACIQTETGSFLKLPTGILEPNLSNYHRISLLLAQQLGVQVKCETISKEGKWHCRLSVLIDTENMWSICISHAVKKNEAVEVASVYVLRHYFSKIFTDLQLSNSIVDLSNTNTISAGYFYK